VRLIEYELPGGWKVLAGRTDADNERLPSEDEISSPENPR